MDIPTEADWRSEGWCPDSEFWCLDSEFLCLDIKSAYKRFAGKTRDEAMAMFVDNALLYGEAVMWMPKRCFGFYVVVFADYLTSERSLWDDAGASSFISVVEVRHEHIRQEQPEVRSAIIRALRAIEANQAWYTDAPDIYGDLAARASKALALIGPG
jgi:hypothetical protein